MMLAGCSSSTLLSPRHRLRSESPTQFQACHFQLPSMNTQRLELPCTLSRKESSRSQPIKSVGVGISVDKPLESRTSGCSLKQNIRLPPLATSNQSVKDEFWDKGKSLKRLAEEGFFDESCTNRAKRKRGNSNAGGDCDEVQGVEDGSLRLGPLGRSSNFLFPSSLELPQQLPFTLTCPGDDQRVCFVPGEVISPSFPLSNNAWVDSVVTEITEVGEKDGESSQIPEKEASGSSSSSDSHSYGLRLGDNVIKEQEIGNGSSNPNRREGATTSHAAGDAQQQEYEGFELVSLLTGCVEAIGSKHIAGINHFISKLGDLASPRGTPISRVVAYYTEALALRATRLWPHVFHITVPRELDRVDDDSATALRLLNQVSPIPKFLHFTANEMILRAFEGKDRVHIIDFDVKQGLQWPSLFQSLASRSNPPSHVRITGIGESKQELNETGDRLAGFAEALNLPFEFHPVVDRLEDVRLWMLHVKEGESVAVNCIFQMHKTLYDANGGALRDFLGLLRSTSPSIVVMGEQEAEHNARNFETRVCNSFKYYSALFDSIDATLPLNSPVRIKIEEMFAREFRNIVACEGRDRHERHEVFEKWFGLIEQGGWFRCVGITEREMLQSQMLLRMYSSSENYKITKKRQDMALMLSWLDQPLYSVSAWAPVDLAGSSSSFSQPS